jgi:hypothetical protein
MNDINTTANTEQSLEAALLEQLKSMSAQLYHIATLLQNISDTIESIQFRNDL